MRPSSPLKSRACLLPAEQGTSGRIAECVYSSCPARERTRTGLESHENASTDANTLLHKQAWIPTRQTASSENYTTDCQLGAYDKLPAQRITPNCQLGLESLSCWRPRVSEQWLEAEFASRGRMLRLVRLYALATSRLSGPAGACRTPAIWQRELRYGLQPRTTQALIVRNRVLCH